MRIQSPLLTLVAVVAAPGLALADTFRAPSADYPTIQSAMDSAGIGDTVIVLPGDHDETVVVTNKFDVTLRGSRGGAIRGLTIDGGSGCRFRNLTVTNGTDGIVVQDAVDLEIVKVQVLDMSGNGIALQDCTRPKIEKVLISGVGGDGIHDDGSEDGIFQKNRIEGCVGDAFDLSSGNVWPNGSDRAVVAKNRIANCENGVVAGGDDLVIEKNRMEGVVDVGILVDSATGSSFATIEKNRIEESPFLVLAVDAEGDNHLVLKNICRDGGIFEGGAFNTVERNQVVADGDGIRVTGISVFVFGNTVRESDTGIHVESDNAILERNRVFDSGNGIAITSGNAYSYRNRVVRAAGIGFLVATTGNFFERDACSGSGDLDLADASAQGVNSYTACRFGVSQYNYVP